VPRYLVERELGDMPDDALNEAVEASREVREGEFPEIGWEHSHVIRVEGSGLRALCVYSAPDPAAIRAYSERAGLPVDGIHEIHADLTPEADSAA
jgi:hypothetical protein